ncbi:hypothetical protein [Pseudocolwellia sp. HL-MZ7]
MDPEAILQVVDNPDIQVLAKEVKDLLLRVSRRISSNLSSEH